jgi:hypothetical protein
LCASGEGSCSLSELGRSCPGAGLHISTGVARLSSHPAPCLLLLLPSAAARSLRLQCNPVLASTFITVAPSASTVSRSPISIIPILRLPRRRALAD